MIDATRRFKRRVMIRLVREARLLRTLHDQGDPWVLGAMVAVLERAYGDPASGTVLARLLHVEADILGDLVAA